MKKTIRTVWSTFLVIHNSVKLFGSTLLVPDQGPNGLPRLSADDKSHRERQSEQRLCYSHQCQTVNRQNVDHDWGSKCIPRLSADDKSRSEQGIIYIG